MTLHAVLATTRVSTFLAKCGSVNNVASSPGPSQILSRSRGEKSGEGLGSKLRHRPEIVDSPQLRDKIWEGPEDEAMNNALFTSLS